MSHPPRPDVRITNPVYQDAEGSVYVTSGAGCQYSSASGEGMAFSRAIQRAIRKRRTEGDHERNSVTITRQRQKHAGKACDFCRWRRIIPFSPGTNTPSAPRPGASPPYQYGIHHFGDLCHRRGRQNPDNP